MSTETTTLLPCPMCGEDRVGFGSTVYDAKTVREQEWGQDTLHFVSCPACQTNNRGVVGGFLTQKDAADIWNRRSSPAPVTGWLHPLTRIDYPDGEWMPRMWDMALASSDNEMVGSALTLKAVAASHGYRASFVQQEVPDDLVAATPAAILAQVAPPTHAPDGVTLVGRTMDEDGILNWYVRPAHGDALAPGAPQPQGAQQPAQDVAETAKRIAWEMRYRLSISYSHHSDVDSLWDDLITPDRDACLAAARASSPAPQAPWTGAEWQGEFTLADYAKMDAAWEAHKAAGPAPQQGVVDRIVGAISDAADRLAAVKHESNDHSHTDGRVDGMREAIGIALCSRQSGESRDNG